MDINHPPPRPSYRYYDLIVGAFVTVLLCANLIGAGKAAVINVPGMGPLVYGAGVLFFPFAYLFGDILTEVYGYAYDRRAVWAGFAALIFAALMSMGCDGGCFSAASAAAPPAPKRIAPSTIAAARSASCRMVLMHYLTSLPHAPSDVTAPAVRF